MKRTGDHKGSTLHSNSTLSWSLEPQQRHSGIIMAITLYPYWGGAVTGGGVFFYSQISWLDHTGYQEPLMRCLIFVSLFFFHSSYKYQQMYTQLVSFLLHGNRWLALNSYLLQTVQKLRCVINEVPKNLHWLGENRRWTTSLRVKIWSACLNDIKAFRPKTTS